MPWFCCLLSRSLLLLLSAILIPGLACRSRGAEGARCFPNGTCDEGLVCLSDRCVSLPVSDGSADAGDASSPDGGPDGRIDAGSGDAGKVCGNGVLDGLERCDGDDLGGATCTSLGQGFTGGTLGCDAACLFDASGCTIPPGCGDGSIDPPEQCDGGEFGGVTCQTLGFSTGALACALGCVFDSTGCWTCGDGLIQPIETCDGSATGGVTCASLGYTGGTLGCAPDCFALDPSTCTGGPPTVPEPRKPINNSYIGSVFVTGSRRPTFEWAPSTVTGGASVSYEIQYSTSSTFSSGVTTAMVTTSSYQPPSDLTVAMTVPVGSRYYWRVRACAMGDCSAYSPTRWVNVGRSDRDFNGDGRADIVIGAPNHGGAAAEGAAYVYLGASTGPEAAPVITIIGGFNQFMGSSVASAGDLNGDAFSDLVVGAPSVSSADPGAAYVYLGGAGAAFDDVSDAALIGEAPGDMFGGSVAGAGDVNADGYDDLLVGARLHDEAAPDSGAAYLFLGGPGGTLDPSPDATFLGGAMNDLFGVVVVSPGDLNADGAADLLVGALGYVLNTGATYVYFGTAGTVPDAVAEGVMTGEATFDGFGVSASGAGDLNDDGFSDVMVAAPYNDATGTDVGRVYFYYGGAGPSFGPIADLTLTGAAAGDYFGTGLAVADLNADGNVDVAVGSTQGASGGTGIVSIYFGSSSGPDSAADTTLFGLFANSGFGLGLHGAGDVNGDGYDDLLVGAPWAMSNGAVYFYEGGAGATLNSVADATYSGSPSEGFGMSVY